jgi:protein involved in temperature-dependent protein secretion
MARTRFVLKRTGVATLLHSPGVRRDVGQRAERVADQARRIAPKVSGNYAEHIDAWTEDNRSRVVGRAGSDVEYATKVEAAHRVFGRAIDAARG